MMYAENAEGSAANFLRRHFRRPDAPADAKPFPIRIEFFYLLFGALVVTIVLVMLVLFRKHNP
jgi:hypothetical protein